MNEHSGDEKQTVQDKLDLIITKLAEHTVKFCYIEKNIGQINAKIDNYNGIVEKIDRLEQFKKDFDKILVYVIGGLALAGTTFVLTKIL